MGKGNGEGEGSGGWQSGLCDCCSSCENCKNDDFDYTSYSNINNMHLYMPFYCLFNLLPVNSKLQKFTIGNETVNSKSKLLILLSKSS